LALDGDEWLTYCLATVPLGNVPAVPVRREAGWVSELVLSYWEEKYFSLLGIQPHIIQPVA